jgi:hypothetical protein
MYSPIKVSLPIHCMFVPLKCFQNEVAYFARVESYRRKMFMKLTPVVDFINILPT